MTNKIQIFAGYDRDQLEIDINKLLAKKSTHKVVGFEYAVSIKNMNNDVNHYIIVHYISR